MNVDTLNVSWIDMLVLLLLCVGLWRGRKRGMSEELLDVIKWALTVLLAGLLYEPVARFILELTSIFSPLACSIVTYLTLVVIIAIAFSFIKTGAGSKLVGSDAFGSAEYYLGMMAGIFRYACIILVGMSFLNARQYTPDELRNSKKFQEDNFGSTFFITLPDLQTEVFTRSLSGRFAREYLSIVLIRPSAGGGTELSGKDNVARARERSVYDILDKK